MGENDQVFNFLPEARVESLLQPLPDLVDRSDPLVDPTLFISLRYEEVLN
jgi:hypothetical protein